MRTETFENIALYCGDCFEVLPTLGNIDAIITDPPYGTTSLAWDTCVDLNALWNEIDKIRKDNAVAVMFSAQPFTTELINSNRKEFRYEIIWKKTTAVGFLDANLRPLRAHENILIFTKSGMFKKSTYNPQKTEGTFYRKKNSEHRCRIYNHHAGIEKAGTTRFPQSVIEYQGDKERFNSRQKNKDLHPTQKPFELMQWLVNTYSNAGDVVLDPFMGSGSTGVACIKTGRKFIGVEMDENYFDTACRRIEQAIKDNERMFPEIRPVFEQKTLVG